MDHPIHFVMVSNGFFVFFFSQHYVIKMPVKGAKGLVITAVTLTGRSYSCLIGY